VRTLVEYIHTGFSDQLNTIAAHGGYGRLPGSELTQLAPSFQAPFSPPFQMNVPEDAAYTEHVCIRADINMARMI
jgi:hypothetical protein